MMLLYLLGGVVALKLLIQLIMDIMFKRMLIPIPLTPMDSFMKMSSSTFDSKGLLWNPIDSEIKADSFAFKGWPIKKNQNQCEQ